MVVDSSDIRLRRAEEDIRTLRNTENRILDHLDGFSETLNETRDIVADNRVRLERVEGRLDSIEGRQKRMADQQKRMADQQKRMADQQKRMVDRQQEMANQQKRMADRLELLEEIALGNDAAIREIQQVVLSIADLLDLTIEKPGRKD